METPKTHRRRVAGGCIFGVLVAAVFCKPLIALAVYAADADLHSHILLVPFISAYLVYIRRQELPPTYGSSPIVAAVFLVAGVGAMVATWTLQSASNPVSYNDYLVLMALSFVCLLVAGGFAFLGKKWMAAAAFPVFFLIFMIPLLDAATEMLETASKLASAEATNLFFGLSGTPFLRSGTVFQLPGIAPEVEFDLDEIQPLRSYDEIRHSLEKKGNFGAPI